MLYTLYNPTYDPIGCCEYEDDVLEEVGCPTSCPGELVIFKHKNGECHCMANPCKVRYEKDTDNMSLRREDRGHYVLGTRGARTRCH